MLFLKLSIVNMLFGKKTLTWKSYTTNKTLPTTKWIQLIDQKEFVIAALDADSNTFIVHVAIRERDEMTIDPNQKSQIKAQSGAQNRA